MEEALIYLNKKNKNLDSPSWEEVSPVIWEKIVDGYFFKEADSFGFMDVLESKDLFPTGLDFFQDWHLVDLGLIEFNGEIISRFELNDNCKNKIREFDFSVHSKGMMPPRNIEDYDSEHYYYEFDEIYFLKDDKLIGRYINHEAMIEFITDNRKRQKLYLLDKEITDNIINAKDL